jgi:hypothetical protein
VSVIQVRGTSGSGKTWVMRQVMKQLDLVPEFIDGRKNPLYYEDTNGPLPAFVLGHYEATCGGCDNIGSAKAVYELIEKMPSRSIILCEGLLLSEDTLHSSRFKDRLKVLFLTTPLEQCLAQIEQRRKASGNDKPLSPDNTMKRVGVIERARQKLVQLGVHCRRASANQAPEIILRWIKEACQHCE